ncbi:MAG: hypothetical protein RIR86_8, partial [Acidobacteriota bacterium]
SWDELLFIQPTGQSSFSKLSANLSNRRLFFAVMGKEYIKPICH